MIFSRPTEWNAAVERLRSLKLLPTALSAAELEEARAALREVSLFSARTMNAAYLQENADVFSEILEGKLDGASARLALRDQADRMDLGAIGDEEGTIKDLRSDARLNLRIRMETERANAFANYTAGQDEDILLAYPAQELYRAEKRNVPRAWPQIWAGAGGQRPGGRMVARKDAEIWTNISRFGVPYPPFDYNSGMDVRDVSRTEAVKLGVLGPADRIAPDKGRRLQQDVQESAAQFDRELIGVLTEDGGYVLEDGVLRLEKRRQDGANAYNPNQPRIPKGNPGGGRFGKLQALPDNAHKLGLDANALGPTMARAREAFLADLADARAKSGGDDEAALGELRNALRVKKPVQASAVISGVSGATAAEDAQIRQGAQGLLDMLPPRVAKALGNFEVRVIDDPKGDFEGEYNTSTRILTINRAFGGVREAVVWHEMMHWVHGHTPIKSYRGAVAEHYQRRTAGEAEVPSKHLREHRPDLFPDHYMGRNYPFAPNAGSEIPTVTGEWLSRDRRGAPAGSRFGWDGSNPAAARRVAVPLSGLFAPGPHQDTAAVGLAIFYYGRRRRKGGNP